MKLHTLAALLASTIAAAAVAAPSTATSTLPPGVKDMSPDQIDYNLQAIDAAAKEQQELARQKEAAPRCCSSCRSGSRRQGKSGR